MSESHEQAGNKAAKQSGSPPPPSSTPRLERYEPEAKVEEELFKACDERIARLNSEGVAQGYNYLNEPKYERNPDLLNMEEYEDWTSENLSSIRVAGEFVGAKINIDDIQKKVTTKVGGTKECMHAMLLGGAGTGKTTLLKRIAKNGRKGEYNMLENKLIIMPDFRVFSPEEKIHPSQALLAGVSDGWDNENMEEKFRWMIAHPDRVVFVIDSLDTLQFDFESDRPRIGYQDKTTIDIIVHNLLAKELFQTSFIISSSREYKVQNLHPSVRPDRCILLDGLKKESIDDLIDGFLGKEKGSEVRQHIDNECPDIWALLSTPVVLVLSLFCFLRGSFKPKTLSGILCTFLSSLIESPHAHAKDVLSVLRRLLPLAFDGVRSRRFLFTPENLNHFHLTIEDVKDLGIFVPQERGCYLASKLMQSEKFFLYFNHQTEQECLAALHATSLDLARFKAFIEQDFHQPRFTVVSRLVCGILLDDEVLEIVRKLVQVQDVNEKKGILLDGLRIELEKGQSKRSVDLFTNLNEAGIGVRALIHSSVRKAVFLGTSLSRSEVQAISSVMKQCQHLELVVFNTCNLNGVKMTILSATVARSDLKVDRLHVVGNDLGEDGMLQLGKFSAHCRVSFLRMGNCRLEWRRLKAFSDGTEGVLKLVKLDIAYNENIGFEGMLQLGRIMYTCKVEDLDARSCRFETEHIKRFVEGAQNAKPRKLYFSDNAKIGPEGMFSLGRYAKDHGVRDLVATRCNPRSDHVEKLIEGLGDTKMNSVFLGDIDNKPEYNRSLLDLIPLVETELDVVRWRITDSQQQEIQRKLDDNASPSLTLTITRGDDNEPIHLKANRWILDRVNIRAQLSNEIELNFKSKSTTREVIGTKGGTVKSVGLKITFPPDVLAHDKEIEASQYFDTSECPEGKILVAPLIQCLPSGRMKSSVLMEVESWAVPTGEEVEVEAYFKDHEDDRWKFAKKVTVGRNRVISFRTDHFSIFGFFMNCACWLRNRLAPPVVKTAVENLVYIGANSHDVACVACLENDEMIEKLSKSFDASGYSRLIPISETRNIPSDAEIHVSVVCNEPDNLEFVNTDDVKRQKCLFQVKNVLSDGKELKCLPIKMNGGDLRTYDGMLRMTYSLLSENRTIEHPMSTVWPIPPPAPTIVHVYGNPRIGVLVAGDAQLLRE